LVAIFIYDHNFTIYCDDLMTKLRRNCNYFTIILWFFENRASDPCSGTSHVNVWTANGP